MFGHGYALHLFQEPKIAERFLCDSCNKVLKKPLVMDCPHAHRFCSECFNDRNKKHPNQLRCPQSDKTPQVSARLEAQRIHPDPQFDLLHFLKIRCKYHKCGYALPPKELADHEKNCENQNLHEFATNEYDAKELRQAIAKHVKPGKEVQTLNDIIATLTEFGVPTYLLHRFTKRSMQSSMGKALASCKIFGERQPVASGLTEYQVEYKNGNGLDDDEGGDGVDHDNEAGDLDGHDDEAGDDEDDHAGDDEDDHAGGEDGHGHSDCGEDELARLNLDGDDTSQIITIDVKVFAEVNEE